MDPTKFTRYGPGKFDLLIDAVTYDYSLDGSLADDCGDTDTTGWFGLIRGPIDLAGCDRASELTAAEREFLAQQQGAILQEGSQGFVSVEYFDNDKELDAAWRFYQRRVNAAECVD
jgi:hypothetical protein